MKAKLIKHILVKADEGKYFLFKEDETGFRIQVCEKLSLKNCQAIENGYDLDELSRKEAEACLDKKKISSLRIGYHKGFQKALELLGDKKFSEEDVLKVVTHVLNELVLVDGFDKQYLFPESIYQETTTKCKSLQQTEWDVEIVEEDKLLGLSLINPIPKLDADGNLILKRK